MERCFPFTSHLLPCLPAIAVPHPVDYGCFLDSEADRDLPYLDHTSNNMTPHRCMLACAYRNFNYAGVQVIAYEVLCSSASEIYSLKMTNYCTLYMLEYRWNVVDTGQM